MPVIYAHEDERGNIIYIGSTIRKVEKRTSEHEKGSLYFNEYLRKNGGLTKLKLIELRYLNECTLQDLHYLERIYIDKYKPICNLRVPKRTEEEIQYQQYERNCNRLESEMQFECMKAIK